MKSQFTPELTSSATAIVSRSFGSMSISTALSNSNGFGRPRRSRRFSGTPPMLASSILFTRWFSIRSSEHPRQAPSLPYNPKLQSLGIHTARRASPLLSLVTEHLPNLQWLDMSIRLGQNEAKLLLEHLPESIRTVRFRVLDNGGSPIDPAFVDRLALRSQRPILHDALESLRLDGCIEELEEYILLPFYTPAAASCNSTKIAKGSTAS
ncbi:MAG: hypothetical protein BYD32DRAFT_456554 [Podila humilis]|nr:MAG: hypothetical protein BYD32DRAFT_456554 [Podila humilis]